MADEHAITLVANPAAPLGAPPPLVPITTAAAIPPPPPPAAQTVPQAPAQPSTEAIMEAVRQALGVQPLITLPPAAPGEATTTFTPYLPGPAAPAPATSLPQSASHPAAVVFPPPPPPPGPAISAVQLSTSTSGKSCLAHSHTPIAYVRYMPKTLSLHGHITYCYHIIRVKLAAG